jgi:Rhodopirellula transposase DDE domain
MKSQREERMNKLSEREIATIKNAASQLTGGKRRAFEAQVALDYLEGRVRQAESVFGWSRQTVALGLNELRSGMHCVERFGERGNRRSEEKLPKLAEDIHLLAEPESQADPKFQSTFQYSRMTAKAMREALSEKQGWDQEELPSTNTIGNIMNRLGYRLRRVQKAKPLKRVRATEAIFAKVKQENQASDARPDSVRISVDIKATVKIGDFGRGGLVRGANETEALDHDFAAKQQLIPLGILDVLSGLLTIIFGTSRQTSDFIADCIQLWWATNLHRYAHIRQLVIDLDNGPENSSFRTQFMRRMVEFADHNHLDVLLVYYPPYHSKYNPIERCWGILEMHWNGALLNSVDSTLAWARSMTWKNRHPVVTLLDKVYAKGVRIAKQAFRKIEQRLQRDPALPKYSVRIQPRGS